MLDALNFLVGYLTIKQLGLVVYERIVNSLTIRP